MMSAVLLTLLLRELETTNPDVHEHMHQALNDLQSKMSDGQFMDEAIEAIRGMIA